MSDDVPAEPVPLSLRCLFWLVNRWCVWSAGLATGSTEYEEVLGCLASLITQKVRTDTGNRGNQWELMAKYVQVSEAGVFPFGSCLGVCCCCCF